MNASAPTGAAAAVARLTLDGDGRLIAAEPALAALNLRAGGRIGAPLAVPPLAVIAGLARRLGIVVARSAVVADDEGDVELWVRAEPDGAGVRLTVSGWRERAGWAPARAAAAVADHPAAGGDWRWRTDAGLRLVEVSIEAGRRHGFDAAGLLGGPVEALFRPGESGIVAPADVLARREPVAALRATLRDGGDTVLLSATVRRDPAGRFAGYDGIARLVEAPPASPLPAPSLPDAFTAGLDRALRRPLAQIVANADSISAATEGPITPDYADYAADIAHAGRHLLALIDDLVDLQAVEHPGFAPAADAIDLADVARRAAGLLAVRAADAGVAIERPLPGVQLWASGDFRRALQILVNLIGNAVRYAPHESIVLIGLRASGGMASITVADEGRGIAEADQARVFDKFQRLDPSEAGGNGLGLYIARRLARAMGGDLTLASAPGEGARFTLTLPVASAR